MEIFLCIPIWLFSWALLLHRNWNWLSVHDLKYSVSFVQQYCKDSCEIVDLSYFIVRYKVNDLVDGNLFDVTMTAEACFVDGASCDYSVPILTNSLIPKVERMWNRTYTFIGRSSWDNVQINELIWYQTLSEIEDKPFDFDELNVTVMVIKILP